MRKAFILLAVFALLRCASGVADPTLPEAVARLELLSVSPSSGSSLTEHSVIEAQIRYAIQNYQPSANYYIAPLFASTKAGVTFNGFDRMTESASLSAPEGTITLRHNVAREMRSPELARPVKLWFYLMERTGAHTTRVLGKTEPIEYSTGA